MGQKSTVALAFAVWATLARAEHVYDGYASFYDEQAGQIFRAPVSNEYLPADYGPTGDSTASWVGRAGRRHLGVTVTSRSIRIDKRTYLYADAVRLPDDSRTDMDPRTVILYVAPTIGASTPDLCVESTGFGSGTADRYSQVYAIATHSQSGARLFKLPSLFGTCRSVFRQRGALQFPSFSYRLENDIDHPVGTEIQYFVIDGKRYIRSHRQLSTRFTVPANVFRFIID